MAELLFRGLVLELQDNGDRTYLGDFITNYRTDHTDTYYEKDIKIKEYHQKIVKYVTNVLKFTFQEYRTQYAYVEYIQGPGTGKPINCKYMVYLVDAYSVLCEARSLQEAIYIIDAITSYEKGKIKNDN